jgi:putative endopeptidase
VTLLRTVALIAIFTSVVSQTLLAAQNVRAQDMDRSVKPGDDFYRFANGAWLKVTTAPAGQPSFGTSAMLIEKTGERVRNLMQESATVGAAKGTITQKVGDYYAAFMGEEAIEARGLKPLAGEMAKISAISNKTALSAYLGSTLGSEVDGLTNNADHIFGVWVNQGFDDSQHCVFHLLQGGLSLPDRDAYLDPSPKIAALRSQYQARIAAILKLAEISDSETKATRILALEIRIAQAHAPDADAADVFKQNNPWKRADFSVKAPGMDWDAYFESAGVSGQPQFIVWQPFAVTGTSALVDSESIDVWKDYLRFHLIQHYASVLPKAVAAILSDAQPPPDRSIGAIAATNGALGHAVGQLYTQRYFPPEAKAKARAMVADLITAYRARIANLTWMSADTKKKAMAKLDALTIGVGYPDT